MDSIAKSLEELRQTFLLQEQQLVPAVAHQQDASTRSGPQASILPSHTTKALSPHGETCSEKQVAVDSRIANTLFDFVDNDDAAFKPDAAKDPETPHEAGDAGAAAAATSKQRCVELQASLDTLSREHNASLTALAKQLEAAQKADAARVIAEESCASEKKARLAAEQALALSRQDYQRLERAVRVCRADLTAMEERRDALVASVATLTQETKLLADTVARTTAALDAKTAECAALRAVEEERDAARARIAALEEERADQTAEWAGMRQYFVDAKARVAEGVAYWAAVQEEHAALKAAVAVYEARIADYEAAEEHGVETCILPLPQVVVTHANPSSENDSVDAALSENEEEEGVELSCSRHKGHNDDLLLSTLEAKVVDLAVSLQQAQQEAQVCRSHLNQHALHTSTTAATIVTLTAALAATTPATTSLVEVLPKQSAALAASEAVVAPLLDRCEQLLQLYAEEAQHARRMESQLASLTSGALAGASARRTRCTSLNDGGQQPCEASTGGRGTASGGDAPSPPTRPEGGHSPFPIHTQAPSHRRTFSYAALKDMEAAAQRRQPRRR